VKRASQYAAFLGTTLAVVLEQRNGHDERAQVLEIMETYEESRLDCSCRPRKIEVLSVASLIEEAIRRIHNRESISSLLPA
jgi:hypothetical protein